MGRTIKSFSNDRAPVRPGKRREEREKKKEDLVGSD